MDQAVRRSISSLALLVDDYDKALRFYTDKLGFILVEDIPISATQRWIKIIPNAQSSVGLHLVLAATENDIRAMGQQAGNSVLMILQTDDFWRDYESMKEGGVTFDETPRQEAYGTVAIFRDLYGNKFDLIEPAS